MTKLLLAGMCVFACAFAQDAPKDAKADAAKPAEKSGPDCPEARSFIVAWESIAQCRLLKRKGKRSISKRRWKRKRPKIGLRIATMGPFDRDSDPCERLPCC